MRSIDLTEYQYVPLLEVLPMLGGHLRMTPRGTLHAYDFAQASMLEAVCATWCLVYTARLPERFIGAMHTCYMYLGMYVL